MNHNAYPYAPSSKDAGSLTRSWGTAPSCYGAYCRVLPSDPSYASSWGTAYTKSVGTPVSFSVGSPIASANGQSWGSQSPYIPSTHGGVAPSSYGGPGTPASSAMSINSPLPHSGPNDPALSIMICPCIDIKSNQMWMDLRYPPSTDKQYNYHREIKEVAFHPPMTYTKIYFQGFPNWSLSIHTSKALTVYAVLEQVYHYLQQCDGPHDSQSARVAFGPQSMSNYREISSQYKAPGGGGKRIDALNGRCICQGFQAAGGRNEWIIHLAHPPRQ